MFLVEVFQNLALEEPRGAWVPCKGLREVKYGWLGMRALRHTARSVGLGSCVLRIYAGSLKCTLEAS